MKKLGTIKKMSNDDVGKELSDRKKCGNGFLTFL